jgi:plastocyanin
MRIGRLGLISLIVATLALVLPGAGGGRAGSPDGPATPKASPAAGGTLEGRVVLSGAAPKRQKMMIVKDAAVCGKIDHLDDRVIVGDGGGLRYAVVTVKGVRNGKACSTMGREFILDQRTCAYSPHVLLVPVGAKLKIVNSDGVLHNVHSFSKLNQAFNVAQPKTNRKVEKSFDVPERIAMKCDVHGWMCAWVVVVPDPYSAVTDEAGRFSIDGIPPGKYTAVCWQEELGERTFEFEVTAGKKVVRDVLYGEAKQQQAGMK